MPIDFAAIAARFAVAFAAQLKNATTAQKGLEKALDRRRAAARLVNEATRQFPIVRFYDGAVTMKLPPSQRGLLTFDTPPRSVAEGIAAGGLSFLTGLGRATEPFRDNSQETVIARFLSGANEALAGVEASLRRFAVPTKEMFNPDQRTASDLFGLAALAFRALSEASGKSGEIKRLTAQIRGTMHVLGMVPADELAPPAEEPATVATRSMAETMDALSYEALAGIVVIGSLPMLVENLLTGLVLTLKSTMLDELANIERQVLDLRGDMFEAVFGGLTRLADRGSHLVGGAHQVIAMNVAFQLKFFRAFGTELAVGVRDFIHGLTEFLGDVVSLLRWLPSMLEAITRFELTDLWSTKVGWITGHVMSISLDNLLNDEGTAVNWVLRGKLNLILDGSEKALRKVRKSPPIRWIVGDKINYGLRQISRARWLVGELFNSGGSGDTIPTLPEATPLRFHSDFPDLGETVFGTATRTGLTTDINRIERALRTGVGTALGRAGRGFDDLAAEYTKDATRSTTVDGRFARVAGQSDLLADTIFGPEVAGERQALRERPEEALAKALESWLADGGFLTVGEVIPGYVKEMATHWRATLTEGTELTAELTPTSPRILRKRATLGKVALPRLTLHAGAGRELDERFADAVADQFADAVRGAYETGRRKLADLAAMGGE